MHNWFENKISKKSEKLTKQNEQTKQTPEPKIVSVPDDVSILSDVSDLDWSNDWSGPHSSDLSDAEQTQDDQSANDNEPELDRPADNNVTKDDDYNDNTHDEESQLDESDDDQNPAKDYLESGNYMPFRKSLELLLGSENSYDHIPGGRKENVYFVINNEANLLSRNNNGKSNFSDDSFRSSFPAYYLDFTSAVPPRNSASAYTFYPHSSLNRQASAACKIDEFNVPLNFEEICQNSPNLLKMTAENKNEADGKSELSMIEELSKDYSRFLDVDASRQRQSFYDSVEEMLTKLDEFGGLVDLIRSDTSLCVDKTLPEIQVKCESMQQIFDRIDKLEMFVNVVRQNVNTMEDCISKAENDMGSISSFKKMFSSFVGQKKPQETKLSFDPPGVFVTEEYLGPPSGSTGAVAELERTQNTEVRDSQNEGVHS